jgi:hypothetical protein
MLNGAEPLLSMRARRASGSGDYDRGLLAALELLDRIDGVQPVCIQRCS